MTEDDRKKSMHKLGYTALTRKFVSMNKMEYKAYQSWLNDCSFGIRGKRFYIDADEDTDTDQYKLKEAFAKNYEDWFLLKCITRRIYDKDKENGVKHHNEYVTWMQTRAKGRHVVITSSGRVFHVMANKRRFKGNKLDKGRDVYEIKKNDTWQVRICDGNKECTKSVRKVKIEGGKTVEHDVYIVTENVRKHLKDCFTKDILLKSLSKSAYEYVKCYGDKRPSHNRSHNMIIVLGEVATNKVCKFNGYKDLANKMNVGYSAIRAKFMRAKDKQITINGNKFIVLRCDKPVIEKKKKYEFKVERELTNRVFLRNLRTSKKMRKSCEYFIEKNTWKMMHDDYRSLYEASLELGMPVKESVIREVLGKWLKGAPRLEEWVQLAKKNINHTMRLTKLRKFYGKRSWEKRKENFKKNTTEFVEWCRRKGIPVYRDYAITVNDVFGTNFKYGPLTVDEKFNN